MKDEDGSIQNTCMKCGNDTKNGLPLCYDCRISLKDFIALANYLNNYKGGKDDLFWLIKSEISTRQSDIISSVNVFTDFENGLIKMIPKEPGNGTARQKPWLKDRYQHIKDTIREIDKLYRALAIAKRYYREKEEQEKKKEEQEKKEQEKKAETDKWPKEEVV